MAAGRGSETVSPGTTTLDLVGELEIVIARTFNGPARIVFDAWTRPELVQRWWAPTSLGVSLAECEATVRVGGGYRYVLRAAPGEQFAFSGRYTEVTPPTRLVYTQLFEPTASGADPADGELIITVTFDERDGRTHVVSRSLCPSKEVRDTIMASGMEHGMRASWDLLDELVASLR